QCKAEHFRGLEVDHQLELRRLQNRQVRWLLTFENPAGVAPDLSKRIDFVWPVRHESAKLSEHARFSAQGNSVMRGQSAQTIAHAVQEQPIDDENCLHAFFCKGRKSGFDFCLSACTHGFHSHPETTGGRLHILRTDLSGTRRITE